MSLEQLATEDYSSVHQAIVATLYRLDLPPQRANQILKHANDLRNSSRFSENHLRIDTDNEAGYDAEIAFMTDPEVFYESLLPIDRLAMGLEALENYITLVEVGIICKPARVYAHTTKSMAKIATKLGFQITSVTPVYSEGTMIDCASELCVDFDTIRDSVLGIKPSLRQRLYKRLEFRDVAEREEP